MNTFAVERTPHLAPAASPRAQSFMPDPARARIASAIRTRDYTSVWREADAARWAAVGVAFTTGVDAMNQLLRGVMAKSDLTAPANGSSQPGPSLTSGGIRAAGAFLRRRVLAPIGRWFARRRLVDELHGLSDAALADIGLRREQIAGFARESYPAYVPETPFAQPPVRVVEPRVPADPARPANDDCARHVA